MAAVAPLQEIPTVLLVLARVHQSGVVTAFHQDGDHQATNAVGPGTQGGGVVVPGATQYGPAVLAHRPLPVHALELAHVPGPTHLTRGIVEAGLGLGPLVVEEGVTVGKTSEIVGPGLQRSILVSAIVKLQNYTELLVSILLCVVKTTLPIQLLAIDESSARMGLAT